LTTRATAEPTTDPAARGHRRSMVRRVLPPAIVVALLLLVALAAWTAVEAARAVGAARDGRGAAAQLQTELAAGQFAAAADSVQRLSGDVDRMSRALASPPLRLAAVAPVVGRDVRAANEVAAGLQEASRGVQPLVTAARGLTPESLLTEGGGIDIQRLQSLAPAVARADRAVAAAQERIAAIDPATLHQPLRGQVVTLQSRLAELRRRGVSSPVPSG
jgi:hypothetical protein